MKLKSLLSLIFIFTVLTQSDAQIWKKVKNAAQRGVERTIENRTERETAQTTDGAIDSVLGKKKSKSRSANESVGDPSATSTGSLEEDSSLSEVGDNQVGFKTGGKILYSDNFEKDAIGDFPAKWNTTLGGEVKKLSGMSEKWFKIPAGSVVNLELTKRLPANFTAEFDLIIPGDIEYALAAIGFNTKKEGYDYTLSPDKGVAVMFYAQDKKPDFRYGHRDIKIIEF